MGLYGTLVEDVLMDNKHFTLEKKLIKSSLFELYFFLISLSNSKNQASALSSV
jgi:hypothetical protein